MRTRTKAAASLFDSIDAQVRGQGFCCQRGNAEVEKDQACSSPIGLIGLLEVEALVPNLRFFSRRNSKSPTKQTATTVTVAAAQTHVPAAAAVGAAASANPTPPTAAPVSTSQTSSGSATAQSAKATPPTSPSNVAAAGKTSAAAPPSIALPSSPASPTKAAPRAPGVYSVPAFTYASLRSPLPLSLLVGYTAGPGVSAGVLLRAWEGAALADIFAVSVDSSKQSGRVYLRNLAVELAASDPPAPEEPIASAAADPNAPAYE